MKNNSFFFLSGIFLLLFNSIIAHSFEATFEQQELVLEDQLSSATDAEQISKITIALAQLKKQQSLAEFKKLPDMVGRERSFLSSSVRDSLNYRQMASSFKSQPGKSSIAYSYQISHYLGLCCIIFAFAGLIARARYRY